MSNTDKKSIYREKLADADFAPPAGAWDNIASQIPPPRKRWWLYWRPLVLALGFPLLLGTGTSPEIGSTKADITPLALVSERLSTPEGGITVPLVEVSNTIPTNANSGIVIEPVNSNDLGNQMGDRPVSSVPSGEGVMGTGQPPTDIHFNLALTAPKGVSKQSEDKTETDRRLYNRLVVLSEHLATPLSVNSLTLDVTDKRSTLQLGSIAQSQWPRERKWRAFFHVSGTFLGKTISPNTEDGVDVTRVTSDGARNEIGNFGAGLRIERNVRGRLWLTTGVEYRRLYDEVDYDYTEGKADSYEYHDTGNPHHLIFTPEHTHHHQKITGTHHVLTASLGAKLTWGYGRRGHSYLTGNALLSKTIGSEIDHVHPISADQSLRLGFEMGIGREWMTGKYGKIRLEPFVQISDGSLYEGKSSIYQVRPYFVGLRLGKTISF
jgi:hypothetical protein